MRPFPPLRCLGVTPPLPALTAGFGQTPDISAFWFSIVTRAGRGHVWQHADKLDPLSLAANAPGWTERRIWGIWGILGTRAPQNPGAVRCRRRPREGSTAPSFRSRAGMPRAGRACGAGTAGINPPATLSATLWPFFARLFCRDTRGIVPVAPHCRICHKYVRDPACSSASHSPGNPSAGFRMSLFQLFSTPGLTLQSCGVGVLLNHSQPSLASLSQPTLLPIPDFPCTLLPTSTFQPCTSLSYMSRGKHSGTRLYPHRCC